MYKKLQNPRNYLLCSLAVADLSIGVVCLPMYATVYLKPELVRGGGKHVCFFWFASMYITSCSALSNIMLISLDRFIAIYFPIRYSIIMSERKCLLYILMIWGFNIGVGIVPSLGFNNYNEYEPNVCRRCYFYVIIPWAYAAAFIHAGVNIGLSLIFDILVFYKVTVLHRRIILQIKMTSSKSKLSSRTSSWSNTQTRFTNISDKKNRINERRKTIWISFVLISMYMIFMLPYIVSLLLESFSNLPKATTERWKVFSQFVYFLNSVFNAPIYVFISNDYKIAYQSLLCTNPFKWRQLRRDSIAMPPFDKENKLTGWSDVIGEETTSTGWRIRHFLLNVGVPKPPPMSREKREKKSKVLLQIENKPGFTSIAPTFKTETTKVLTFKTDSTSF